MVNISCIAFARSPKTCRPLTFEDSAWKQPEERLKQPEERLKLIFLVPLHNLFDINMLDYNPWRLRFNRWTTYTKKTKKKV